MQLQHRCLLLRLIVGRHLYLLRSRGDISPMNEPSSFARKMRLCCNVDTRPITDSPEISFVTHSFAQCDAPAILDPSSISIHYHEQSAKQAPTSSSFTSPNHVFPKSEPPQIEALLAETYTSLLAVRSTSALEQCIPRFVIS
jgi:hypothetical protein